MSNDEKTENSQEEFPETEVNNDSDVVYDDDTGAAVLKRLRERIKTLEKEKQEYLDGWQRMKADVVNRDKAAAEEKSRVSELVKEHMLEQLLPILDAFDAAFTGSSWEKVDTNWRVGIEYIHTQFKKVLEENGIAAFGSVGEVFDASRHDVASESEVEGVSGTVSKVLRSGYSVQGRIIRPARVEIYK